ncbi:MAG: DUF2225 domain-containing protein, partial [Planctomycetes bacterium]|nr:DUF2225 domain-containing protein [Planctomycetota bacterium]
MTRTLLLFLVLFSCATFNSEAEGRIRKSRTEPEKQQESKDQKSSPEEQKETEIEKQEKKAFGRLAHRSKIMLQEGEGHRSLSNVAGKSSRIPLVCPLCAQDFIGINVKEQAADKGIDRDLCRHSFSKSAYDFDFWTCPACGYTNIKHFFPSIDKEVFGEERKTATTLLMDQLFSMQMGVNISKVGFKLDQEDIPTNIKYALYSKNSKLFDYDWNIKADIHLKYAWTERARFIAPILSPSLSNSNTIIRKKLEKYEEA